MGSKRDDPHARPTEFPQHSVELPEYQIAKFQTTRGEYRKFIEAGGYTNQEYWSSEGWEWKESDRILYTVLRGKVTEDVRSSSEEPRLEPQYWADEQDWGTGAFVQTDDHPVVGVTYFEAEAYCKWAGVRLPTEAEWEKAARWTGSHPNIWPWGDTWDPEKCNNLLGRNPAAGGYKKMQSSPVGSYPDGASPYGCMDMVGNAYEWVSDWAVSYPGNPEPFDHTGFRFVRGGCWDDGPASNRCACRGWYLPPGSGGTGPGDCDYIGFRVAR